MLRIHDLETDASLDLQIPWTLEKAFRVQLGRHFDAGGHSRLTSEMGGWLAVALYQLVDRDLLPPTERQWALADRICKALDDRCSHRSLCVSGIDGRFHSLSLSSVRCLPRKHRSLRRTAAAVVPTRISDDIARRFQGPRAT
jgi:hypothetical protein